MPIKQPLQLLAWRDLDISCWALFRSWPGIWCLLFIQVFSRRLVPLPEIGFAQRVWDTGGGADHTLNKPGRYDLYKLQVCYGSDTKK
jgi:hypothetical protein